MITLRQLEHLFCLVEQLSKTEDKKEFHPEKNAFIHSCQVVKHALRETDDKSLVLAALSHDVGKAKNSHKHPEIGHGVLTDMGLLTAGLLVKDHMRAQLFIDGKMRKLSKVRKFASSPLFSGLMQLRRWDVMGRNAREVPDWEKLKTNIRNTVL